MGNRLLIVDDEEAILFAMRDYFTFQGYEVDCARTVAEAENLLRLACYAAVVADLCLTGSAGYEGLDVLRKARACSQSCRTVLLTAFGTADLEREARRNGVDLFLHKPQPLPLIQQQLLALSSGPAKMSIR
jgi:DNA-binding response OmpR family regulator